MAANARAAATAAAAGVKPLNILAGVRSACEFYEL